MNFLYPGFLWGFTLLSIPVLIHLFNFKRYKTLYFSSLSFIKHVDQQTKSTQKVKHLLILISRLLAFSFLILAFAQPYFGTIIEEKNENGEVIMMYIDNSFSMQAKGVEGELLSQVQEKARQIILTSGKDIRFIIGTNEMSGNEEHILNQAEALNKIDEIKYSNLPRNSNEILKWQTELLTKNETPIPVRKYLYFTDFQKITSNKLEKTPQFKGQFVPIQVVPEKTSNIYIDSVWFSSPIHKQESNSEINISIKNDSKNDIENLELTSIIGGKNKSISISVPANGKATTVFSYREGKNGFVKGELTIADDNINFDDKFYFSYTVSNAKILIINGEDFIPNFEQVYQLDTYYNSKSKSINSLTRQDIENNDLILLNGVNKISTGLQDQLINHYSTSGAIACFPGKNPNKSEWNRLLGKLSLPKLGNIVSTGNRIKTLEYADKFFEGVFEKEVTTLNLPSVGQVNQAVGGEGFPLIRLENELPLLIKQEGKGTSFCFYASVHPDVNAIVNNALFIAMTLRIGELSKRFQPLQITLGENSKFPVFDYNNPEQPLHMKGNKIDFIPQNEIIRGNYFISLNNNSTNKSVTAGNFDLIGNDKKIGTISLNLNRDESQLSYLSKDDISELFKEIKNVKLNEISSKSSFDFKSIDKPFSFWKICMILTLIFVLSEMALVRFLK